MFIYILLAVVIGACALLETGTLTNKSVRNFYVCLTVFLLVVGLRYMHGDYGTYQMGFDERIDVGGDKGYFLLQLFAKNIGLNFQVFVFLITLFSVFCFREIFKLSLWPSFGMVVVLGKIFTMYAMSGIRQYMAMALCWWALMELLAKKRRLLFLLMLFIAYTLHGSAIVFLPVFLLTKYKFSYKIASFIILVSIAVGYWMLSLYGAAAEMSDLVRTRFGSYVQDSSEVGMSMLNYAENILFLVLALSVRKIAVTKIPYYDFFLYMFVIYCGFLIAGEDIGVVKRLRDYYTISYAFIVPGFIYLFKDKSSRKVAYMVFVVYFIFLMFRSLQVYDAPFSPDNYNRMMPYHSIFQMK